jgi:hypothetical protein
MGNNEVFRGSFCWEHQPSNLTRTDHDNCVDIVVYHEGMQLSTRYMMEDVCIHPSCMNQEEHAGFCRDHFQRPSGKLEQACGIIQTFMIEKQNRDIRDLQFEEADRRRTAMISASFDQRMDLMVGEYLKNSSAEFVQKIKSHYAGGGQGH